MIRIWNWIMNALRINRVHSPRAVANYFMERAAKEGRKLGVAQLVRLVYLAHGWCLGYTGKPLISGRVEAWKYGPVVPEVYFTFGRQGTIAIARSVNAWGNALKPKFTERQRQIVDRVFDAYSKFPVSALFNGTSSDGSPWHQVKAEGLRTVIPDDIIRKYHEDLITQDQDPRSTAQEFQESNLA